MSTRLCLAKDGLTQVHLTKDQIDVVCSAFECASSVLDDLTLLSSSSSSSLDRRSCSSSTVPMLDDTCDSYSCTGYHPFGGSLSSRYNKNREGFVFSNGELFSTTCTTKTRDTFESCMEKIRHELDAIALRFLTAIEEELHLPNRYFLQEFGLGAQSFVSYSQWHIKRYRPDEDTFRPHLLPVHTDPSLLSVVVHDAPGIVEGGLGLEYATRSGGVEEAKWKEIPFHGHGIATIMIGAAFGRIMHAGNLTSTNSKEGSGSNDSAAIRKLYPPLRHRVRNIYNGSSSTPTHHNIYRMAITYFLRPAPASVLRPLPIFQENPLVQKNHSESRPMRFDDFYKRVSSRYRKSSNSSTSSRNMPNNANEADKNHKNENSRMKITATVPQPLGKEDNPSGWDRSNCTLLYPMDSPLVGREQYLGGELGLADAHVYAIPGCAKRVLKINPESDDITLIGPSFEGGFKWLRSVQTSRGIIYGLPCHADCILRIDTYSGQITTIGHNLVDSCVGRPWKYHGGAICPIDGCIYCVPTCADRILKIDPETDEVTLIGGPFEGRNKWYGALVGKDGAIYGIPHNAPGVLRIDPSTDPIVTLHGNFPDGGHKWHGAVLAPNGSIIGIPANADTILKVDPCKDAIVSVFSDASVIRSGSHRADGKYKFLGGVVGEDGHVYFIPSDAERVVQVDVTRGIAREVGPNLTMKEPIRNNKWQNGFLSNVDGAIYAIPLKAQTVLRIETRRKEGMAAKDNSEPTISTIGGSFTGLNKWEGGVLAKNGSMYCMPLNCKAVLKVSPMTSILANATYL